MAKAKEKEEKTDPTQKIETTLDLEVLTLKQGAWHLRIIIPQALKSTFLRYKVALAFDDSPFRRRIEQIERQLNSGLFKDDPSQKEQAKEEIEQVEAEIAELEEKCSDIEFVATTEALKYVPKGLRLELAIPDDVIGDFNEQKERLMHYKATLTPFV